jgi:plastocyanin
MPAEREVNGARRPAGRSPGGRSGRLAAICAAGLAALAAAGCGSAQIKGGDNVNLIAGKKAFVAKCGSCHTLARADTKGTVGPNLDEAFRASIREGLVPGSQRAAIRGTVEEQIKIPYIYGAMPKNLVRGATARDVAAYVAASVDKPGKDTGLLATAVEAPGAGKPAVETGGKLSIEASPTGQLSYVTDKATATPGKVTIEMPNMSGVSHNIAIETGEGGATAKGTVLGHGAFTTKGTSSVEVTLKAGTYTYFCQAPGHRQAGMWGTITVK